jgi:TPR repeat protein
VVLADEDRERLRVSDHELYLSEGPLVDSRLVRGAHLRWPSQEAPFIPFDLMIEWQPEGRRTVKAATAARVGQKMAISVMHRLESLPKILTAVDSPEINLIPASRDSMALYKQLLRDLTPPIDVAALQLLRDHCQQGRSDNCMLLAQESLRGRDTPYDPGLALESFQAACQQGRGEGCYQATKVLAASHGLPSSSETVLSLLRQGCALKHLSSCHGVAEMLLDTRSDRRTPEMIAEAKSLLSSACDGEFGESCYKLAELLFKQEGEPARGRAVGLMERSCQDGYFLACRELGDLALQGTTPDQTAALRWFTAACALDAHRGTYFVPCHSRPEQEKRQELMRAARCPIRQSPRCTSSADGETHP